MRRKELSCSNAVTEALQKRASAESRHPSRDEVGDDQDDPMGKKGGVEKDLFPGQTR